MFTQMLKNQKVTFVNDVKEAEQFSPFFMWHNLKSGCYVVSRREGVKHIDKQPMPVAAGLTEEEAKACVMFKANEYIYRGLQK